MSLSNKTHAMTGHDLKNHRIKKCPRTVNIRHSRFTAKFSVLSTMTIFLKFSNPSELIVCQTPHSFLIHVILLIHSPHLECLLSAYLSYVSFLFLWLVIFSLLLQSLPSTFKSRVTCQQ